MSQAHGEKLRIFTDDSLQEDKRHGTGAFPLSFYQENMDQFASFRIDWHWHPEVEFLTVKSGEVRCSAGREDILLHEGDSVFINSSVVHRYLSEQSAKIPNIVFSPFLIAPKDSLIYDKYILPLLTRGPACMTLRACTDWQGDAGKLLSDIYTEMTAPDPNQLMTLQKVTMLWELLHEHAEQMEENKARGEALCQVRLRLMLQYIQSHYQENVTLEDIARAGLVSKSHALGIFRSEIKESPVAYLIRYRLQRAAELLEHSKKSVAFIAEETGFSSSSYFCRKFMEHYHVSPGKYRALCMR